MADRKSFGTNKYAAATAASFLVIFFGMMTSIVLAVGSGADPVLSVISAVLVFGIILQLPLRAFRPRRTPQFPRSLPIPGESFWSVVKNAFSREDKQKRPIRPWKRKQSDFVPQPHGAEYYEQKCFVPERPEKHDSN